MGVFSANEIYGSSIIASEITIEVDIANGNRSSMSHRMKEKETSRKLFSHSIFCLSNFLCRFVAFLVYAPFV
jgi:hypothetical protein